METKYLTSEKEYEIELLNTKNELSELRLGAARKRNIGLGMGLLIFSALILWLFKLYRRTKFQKEEISNANKDKEVLLKEIHHRVKNNLQVVSSLLSMQSKFVEDGSVLAAINTGKSRVNSMSILHKSLYKKDDLKNINVRDYFEELIDSLVATYQVNEMKISDGSVRSTILCIATPWCGVSIFIYLSLLSTNHKLNNHGRFSSAQEK